MFARTSSSEGNWTWLMSVFINNVKCSVFCCRGRVVPGVSLSLF